jgi:pentose-5-phosphate-3-epimerase
VLRELVQEVAPMRLAGSVLTAAPDDREQLSRDLAAAGAEVHVDVIDNSYPRAEGVPLSFLRTQHERGTLEVHLMVRDPLALLDEVLAARPRTVIAQIEDLHDQPTAVRRFIDACRGAGAEAWLGIAPGTDRTVLEPWSGQVDGALVMLTPPGVHGGSADLHHLDGIPRSIPLIEVDGGVGPDLVPDLRRRGVDRAVMGRALMDTITR